jgi:hypothetical protein
MKTTPLLALCLFAALPGIGWAANWSRLLDAFAECSEGARASIHASEEAAARLTGKGKLLTEAAEREARQLADALPGPRPASLAETLARTLTRQGADAETVRFLQSLPAEQLEAAAVYAHGGRRLREAVADVAIRGRITQQGGAPALAALGLADDIPADDLLRLDALVVGRRLPLEVAGQPTLARFGTLLSDSSDRFRIFYGRYIRGREKEWLAGGALAAWLAFPDEFQNAAGDLSEAGFTRLGGLVGEINARAIAGFAVGSKTAAKKTIRAVIDGFFTGEDAWAAWLGAVLLLGIVLALFPRLRWLLLAPFRWLRSNR